MEDFPNPSITNPALIVKQKEEKVPLIPYDPQAALQLMASRDPLPPVFNSPSDVTEITPGLVAFNTYTLKPARVEDFLQLSKSDE
jgi:hypothetical protein